jgi:hypothetical protein
MGHYLQAIIGKMEDIAPLRRAYNNAELIELTQEFALVPMTEDLFDEINEGVKSESIEKLTHFTANIETKIVHELGLRQFAYVESEFFGGIGGHICLVYGESPSSKILPSSYHSMNQALRQLGIKRKGEFDEFLTLGLDRYRSTEEWLDEVS